ncbi:acetyltransferase [Herbiconiux solani]|uniref:acetyltransferase n=1 Tax=Herbiconiux solani TaxID=661329 RepID=UPI0008262FF3|nr:acetyltransferase [Herbiconiux solani]
MKSDANGRNLDAEVPVIDLSAAPGERAAWDRPKIVVYIWALFELVFVTNAWQISSGIRTRVLRLFGAEIGEGVVFRPRTRVKFPWKLHIGDRSWIGEGVWFHNQDHIYIGSDVVISQETMLTTGSHAHRRDMALITKPIFIEDGAWVTSRCMVLGGVRIGRSALISPMTVVNKDIEENTIVGSAQNVSLGRRFDDSKASRAKQ